MNDESMTWTFSADDLNAVDAALAVLESRFGNLLSLRQEVSRGWARMGEKSEAFCRQTLAAMLVSPQGVQTDFDLGMAQADLAAIDALHPRLQRLRRLTGRAEDTEMALGCDVMVAALQARAYLQAADPSSKELLRCDAPAIQSVAQV